MSTNLFVIAALFITLIQKILTNNSSLIYTGRTKTLVLIDDWHTIDTHSLFWNQLRGRIFFLKLGMNAELDFKMVDDPYIKLQFFGEYLYSNIIYVASSYNEEYSKKTEIKMANLLKYFDEGHDIMVFADKDVGNFLRKFVTEFGIDFDDYVFYYLKKGFSSKRQLIHS